jgi:hypothetical protein
VQILGAAPLEYSVRARLLSSVSTGCAGHSYGDRGQFDGTDKRTPISADGENKVQCHNVHTMQYSSITASRAWRYAHSMCRSM